MNQFEICAKRLKKMFDNYISIELENWLRFVGHGDILKIDKNTILKEPFTIEKRLNFIISGSGGVLQWNNNNFVCLDFAFQDNFLCDYVSFIEQKESDLETLVFEESTLFQISYDNFSLMLKSERGEKLRRLIAEGIMQSQQDTTKDLMTKTAKIRYNDLLLKYPDKLNMIPHKYIASYLGITPQSFSRLKKEL
jgi:CRP-like cAMP-binding protein